MYDFTVHPSILYVEDAKHKTVNLICDLVNAASDRAAIVDLDVFAQRTQLRHDNGESMFAGP